MNLPMQPTNVELWNAEFIVRNQDVFYSERNCHIALWVSTYSKYILYVTNEKI